MSFHPSNGASPKIPKGRSSPIKKKLLEKNRNLTQNKKISNQNSTFTNNKKPNIKVDYNSSNYFYNDENYYNTNNYNKMNYYNKDKKSQRYVIDTNDSYTSIEQENGNIEYIPKEYLKYKRISPHNNKNIRYYEEEVSENYYNESDNMYYENEDDYEQELITHQPQIKQYEYQEIPNYYLTQRNNNNNTNINIKKKIKKKLNHNMTSKELSYQYNSNQLSKGKNIKVERSLNNCGNNTTTTNNTYNNNIYYINPITVKNIKKNKKEEINRNKPKRNNHKTYNDINKKNSVYKNVNIILNNKKTNKENDYFKMNNIVDKSLKQKYIKAAILIQSIIRVFIVKIKIYNSLNIYLTCKKVIEILQNCILSKKLIFWKIFKDYISRKSYNDLKNKEKKPKEKNQYINFHKELGDSFNIIIDKNKKENNEKQLKTKLNDILKENDLLKSQLFGNKNIEEKMKNLMDENKKNKNINDIIMKDNQQLAKKLKDIQDYRNTNLIIQNQQSIDLTQEQKMQIEELIKNNEIYLEKLKYYSLLKIVNKKINKEINIIKNNFNKYRNIVTKINIKEKEDNIKKEIFMKILYIKIADKLKLIKQKYFSKLNYVSIILKNEENHKMEIINKNLISIINNKEKNIKNILCKAFFKYYNNVIKYRNKEIIEKEEEKEEQNKELLKRTLLKKIFKNYCKKRLFIYKIFIEKWNLKSKILGMRAVARDKKKKRKLKKKNNRLKYQKYFGLVEKKNTPNLNQNICRSIHEFSYIVSKGTVIKESSSNEPVNDIMNNKISISRDKINKVNDKKNIGIMKKTKSVNKIEKRIQKDNKNYDNNKENINCNEDSEEDSGDSLGLGNNSD